MEVAFLTGADKFRRLPPKTAVFVGHEYTETLAPWAAWLEPDNEAVNDKLDWVLRQRYGAYDPMPTIPSTVDFEMRTNPYLRCNEPKMLRRLGLPLEALRKETQPQKLEREAAALNKLLKLKRDTIAYSLLPTGLPRSYRDGIDMAKVRVPVFVQAVQKVKRIALIQGPLHRWRDQAGIKPRPHLPASAREPEMAPSQGINAVVRVPTGLHSQAIHAAGVGDHEVVLEMAEMRASSEFNGAEGDTIDESGDSTAVDDVVIGLEGGGEGPPAAGEEASDDAPKADPPAGATAEDPTVEAATTKEMV